MGDCTPASPLSPGRSIVIKLFAAASPAPRSAGANTRIQMRVKGNFRGGKIGGLLNRSDYESRLRVRVAAALHPQPPLPQLLEMGLGVSASYARYINLRFALGP